MTEDVTKLTFVDKGVEYPLFPFDEPVTITLPNGTSHHFRLWDEVTEKRREDLLKTIVITSPAVIDGENPRDAKTDYTRATLRYYDMMIESISGVVLNGNNPEDKLSAHQVIKDRLNEEGKPLRILDMVGVPVRKAAAGRLYGGKIEVERPHDDDEETTFTGDPFEDITEAVEEAEKPKTVYSLTLSRDIVIRQELGIERLRSGVTTEPKNVIRYHFREPQGNDFSKWELKAYRGYAVSRPKGGERAERYYNLETVKNLFDSLIEKIEGASINGRPIGLVSDRDDKHRVALLAMVPLSIKKITVATLFQELSNLGNF